MINPITKKHVQALFSMARPKGSPHSEKKDPAPWPKKKEDV